MSTWVTGVDSVTKRFPAAVEDALAEHLIAPAAAAAAQAALTDSPAVTAAATAAATTAVSDALTAGDVARRTDPGIPRAVADDGTYLAVVTDTEGRLVEAVTATGRKVLPAADIASATVGDASITHAAVATAEITRATVAGATTDAAPTSAYVRCTVDSMGRIAEDAIGLDGRVPDWVIAAWRSRMSVPDPVTDLPAASGVRPWKKLAAWGDSMTEGYGGGGTDWPAVCAATLGIERYNAGKSGYTSTEEAVLMGGIQLAITVSGNQVEASGATSVTAVSPNTSFRTTVARSFVGTLAGVPGTLAKDASNVWTFTRTASGSVVPCPAGTLFVSTFVTVPYIDWITTVWLGRNNTLTPANVDRDIAAMVAVLRPITKRFLVISVLNAQDEPSGSGGYSQVATINSNLSTTYGASFVNLRGWLIANGLAAAGISATAGDTTAISEDRIPPSLMSDNLHLNAAGYTVTGNYIASIITAKGWLL